MVMSACIACSLRTKANAAHHFSLRTVGRELRNSFWDLLLPVGIIVDLRRLCHHQRGLCTMYVAGSVIFRESACGVTCPGY
jgi:TRAP-type C4-dicarboxylate transport system permease large subunit